MQRGRCLKRRIIRLLGRRFSGGRYFNDLLFPVALVEYLRQDRETGLESIAMWSGVRVLTQKTPEFGANMRQTGGAGEQGATIRSGTRVVTLKPLKFRAILRQGKGNGAQNATL